MNTQLTTFYVPGSFSRIGVHPPDKVVIESSDMAKQVLTAFIQHTSGVHRLFAYAIGKYHADFLVRWHNVSGVFDYLNRKDVFNGEIRNQKELANNAKASGLSINVLLSVHIKRLLSEFVKQSCSICSGENLIKNSIFNLYRISAIDDNNIAQHIHNIHSFVVPETMLLSSRKSFISDLPTRLPRTEVLHLFGGREKFIQTHLESRVSDAVHTK